MALTPDGAAIRQLREASGWNLRTLADKAEISAGYLSKIETKNARRVSAELLARIAGSLGVSLAAIMGDRAAFRAAYKSALRQPRAVGQTQAEQVA